MSGWDEVIAAIGQAQQGGSEGRAALLEQWEASEDDDHARRCVLAHYLADREPDLAHEVAWDEVALREHRMLEDDALAAIGIPSVSGLAPSLHLNLADGYLRQGRLGESHEHFEAGLAAADALGDDGYGAMIRGGLEALAQRLASADGA